MSSFTSRILVALCLLPVVLGAVYLGHWWLFALIALASAISLHEYWLMARSLAPLALGGYIAGGLALVGAELSGLDWMLGGLMSVFALGFLLKAISGARAAATAAVSGTVMGTFWVCGGLGFVLLLRNLPEHGRLAVFTVMIAVWAGD